MRVFLSSGERLALVCYRTSYSGLLLSASTSVQDGSVAVFAAHTAFEDPSSPVGVPHRESIEARTLVFYD